MSYLAKNYNRKKIAFKYGKGNYLYSTNGKKYLDFVQGIDVNSLGHAHPKLVKKISPSVFGLKFVDLRKHASDAVSGPVDFSQLFLAFGFFVVLAGLSLGTLIFGFSLEQRMNINLQIEILMRVAKF